MDFRFDDEQVALGDAIRTLCAQLFPLDAVAAREGTEAAADTWRALAEIGVFGLLLPSEPGGAVEAAIAFEQFGAHLATGPRLWSMIAAPFVAGVVDGDVRVTGLELTTATRAPFVIEHAAASDVVLITHEDRIEQGAIADLPASFEEGDPFDPLTPARAYSTPPRGTAIGDADDAARLRRIGAILTAAELVGVAQGALDVASAYALERQQFGVPIGSFQAVKHLLADMYVRVELARSATYAAAATFDDDRAGDATTAASAAKVLATEAGIANGRTAVQVLGGMGFTWEMTPHYFLKRAWQLEATFGTGDAHALTISAALEAEVRPEVATWT
jgi:alkylation response protein AidB-like acyl-CoA dehydrogenase